MPKLAQRSERTPWDEDDGVSELQDKVGELLEDAHVIPQHVIDKIMTLIRDAEQNYDGPPDPDWMKDAVFDPMD